MSSTDTNIPTPRTDAAEHGEIRLRSFSVTIPSVDGKAILKRVTVKNVPMEWDENVQDWIIPSSGLNMIEAVKATHIIKVLRGENRKLERELAQAKADLSAARKDSERLDWLSSQEARVLNSGGYFLYWGDTDDTGGEWQTGRFDSPREAIDAAMEGGEQ